MLRGYKRGESLKRVLTATFHFFDFARTELTASFLLFFLLDLRTERFVMSEHLTKVTDLELSF
jgi:hypothetical protein